MTESAGPIDFARVRGFNFNSRTTTRAHHARLAGVVVPIDGTNYPRTVRSKLMGIKPSNEPAHRFGVRRLAACDGRMGPLSGMRRAGALSRNVSAWEEILDLEFAHLIGFKNLGCVPWTAAAHSAIIGA